MKRKISAAFAAVIAAGAITGCVPRIAREAVNAVSDQVSNTAEEEPEKEDPYEAYVRDILERQLGSMRDLSFTYGFVRRNTDTAYWYAEAETAPLDDGLISASKQDLDKDGQEELLVTYLEGSRGTGSGHNCLRMDVYAIAEGQVRKIGGISFPNCFETYNSETYMAGTKDMGDYQLLYVYDDRGVWTWADGVNPQIRLYRYDGRRMDEIYSVSCSGSDGSWWEEWERDLRTLGFEIPGGLWNNECLEGESGFQVLMYGEGTTIADTKVMYNYGSGVGSEQQYMLDKGVVEAGIHGETGSVVERMNRSMKPYSENTADYIIPDSSIRYLTRTELLGLSAEQLRLARNEIYARHGRKFQTQDLQDYFNSKSWYMGTIEPDRFSDDNLNVYEKENLKLIKSLEQ